MNDVPENELLSAYLDGELSAAEQADVERLLATSQAARQLLDELRTLSSTLQALPQYKLDEDLSQRVLRSAERQILTEPDRLPSPAPAPVAARRRAMFRRLLNPRVVAWSGAAVAVAVMLMMMEPEPPHRHAGDELARGPEAPEAEAPRELRPATPARTGGAKPSDGEPLVAAEEASEVCEDPMERGSRYHAKALKAGAPHGDVASLEVVNGGAEADAFQFDQKSKTAPKTRDARLASKTYDPGKADGPAAKAFEGKMAARGIVAEKPEADLSQTDEPLERDEYFHSKKAEGGGIGGAGGMGMGYGGYDSAVTNLRTYLSKQVGTAAGEILVVQCNLSPQAAEKQALDQVFRDNGIVRGKTESGAFYRRLGLRDKQAEQKWSLLEVQRKLEQLAEGSREDVSAALGELAHVNNQKLVLVSATPDQVEATLVALNKKASEFLTLHIDPAPAFEEQKKFGRYNRDLQLAQVLEGKRIEAIRERAELARELEADGELAEQVTAKGGAGVSNFDNEQPDGEQMGPFGGVQQGAALPGAAHGQEAETDQALRESVQDSVSQPILGASLPPASRTADSSADAAPADRPDRLSGPAKQPADPGWARGGQQQAGKGIAGRTLDGTVPAEPVPEVPVVPSQPSVQGENPPTPPAAPPAVQAPAARAPVSQSGKARFDSVGKVAKPGPGSAPTVVAGDETDRSGTDAFEKPPGEKITPHVGAGKDQTRDHNVNGTLEETPVAEPAPPAPGGPPLDEPSEEIAAAGGQAPRPTMPAPEAEPVGGRARPVDRGGMEPQAPPGQTEHRTDGDNSSAVAKGEPVTPVDPKPEAETPAEPRSRQESHQQLASEPVPVYRVLFVLQVIGDHFSQPGGTAASVAAPADATPVEAGPVDVAPAEPPPPAEPQ